jgi:hypothetical protein
MSRSKLSLMVAAAVLMSGCTKLFESDGTPESEVVRKWLSADSTILHDDPLIEPEARLVMSDYDVALSRPSLRRLGPDRRPGCQPSTLRWNGNSVEARWSCPAGTDEAFRTVYFHVRNGRVASANYTEAYQAVAPD